MPPSKEGPHHPANLRPQGLETGAWSPAEGDDGGGGAGTRLSVEAADPYQPWEPK